MNIWVICHFLEAWEDVELIFSKLRSNGTEISVVCAEGNLFGGVITSTSEQVRNYLEQRGISWNILESDFIDFVDRDEDFFRNNIIIPLTHYPGSLSSKMANLILRADHVHYIPYGYPIKEIEIGKGSDLDPRLNICKVYAEDENEAEVWRLNRRVGKVFVTQRIFSVKYIANILGKSRVLVNFHHTYVSGGTNHGARGGLVNSLDELFLIFDRNRNLDFVLMFHPIFRLKLEEFKKESNTSEFQEWESLSQKVGLCPNVTISAAINWRSEWEKASLILAESPSLIYKGNKIYPRKKMIIASFNPEITAYPNHVLRSFVPTVTNLSEFQRHLSYLNDSENKTSRLEHFLKLLDRLINYMRLTRAFLIIRREISNCDHSVL